MTRLASRLKVIVAITAAVLLLAVYYSVNQASAAAGINKSVNFQGKVVNANGTNVTDGSYSFRFRIYTSTAPTDAAAACSANTCLWEENKTVAVTNGIFQTNLGDTTALPGSVDFNTDTLYLAVQFNGDTEMSPRIRLTAVPYAFNSDKLGGLDKSAFVQLSPGSQQTGSVNVSGNIQSGGTLQGNTLDAATAGALTVGSTNASSVILAKNTTVSSGATLTLQGSNALILGSTSVAGGMVFKDGTVNGYGITLATGALTGNQSISLPNGTGTICLSNGNCSGLGGNGNILQNGNSFTTALTLGTNDNYDFNLETFNTTRMTVKNTGDITMDNGTLLVDATNHRVGVGAASPQAALHISSSTVGQALLRVTDGTATAVDVMNIADEGAVTFRNRTDSAAAFQVLTLAQLPVLSVDTSGYKVIVNSTLQTAATAATSSNSNNLTLITGNATGLTSNSGDVRIDTGTATGTTGVIKIADANASGIVLGRTGVGVTIPSASSLTLGSSLSSNGAIRFLNSTNSNILTLQSGVTSANLTLTLPISDGTNGNCLQTNGAGALSFGSCTGSPGSNAATVALDNLTSVAINTSLLPGTAGTVHLGSATKSFGDLFIAGTSSTPASNYFRITGAATTARTITLPDATGTVCLSVGNCSGSGSTLQADYTASVGGTIPEIKVDTTRAGVDIQDADVSINGNLFNVRQSNSSGLGNSIFNVYSTGSIGVNMGANTTPSADLTFGDGADRTVNVLSRTTNAAGNKLTVRAGSAGAGATAAAGGSLVLQGGDANGTTGNANGGDVQLYGGAKINSGTAGNVILAYNGTSAVGNVAIGKAAPGYPLDVAGDINTSTGYRVGGTIGSTISACGAGSFIQNQSTAGGITTGGSCVAANTLTTLQNAYNNSSPASILLADAKDFTITAADTTTDPSVVVNLQCVTCSANGGRFAIQNASTDVFLVKADGTIRIGDATNNMSFNASTREPTLNGSARHIRRVTLVPEYRGAVMTPDGTTNSGTMTSDFCSGTSRLSLNTTVCAATDEHNYYTWTSSSGDNDYDIYIRYQMPSDFAGFSSDTSINMFGWRTDATNNRVELTVLNAAGGICQSATNVATGTGTWTETATTGNETSDATCTAIAANDIIILRVKLTASASEFARAGEIRFDYLSKW